MKKSILTSIVAAVLVSPALSAPLLIPAPQQQQWNDEAHLNISTFKVFAPDSLTFEKDILTQKLTRWGAKSGNGTLITLKTNTNIQKGYQLTITAKDIQIIGKDKAAAFHGIQTLFQCINLDQTGVKRFQLTQGKVTDAARYNWRGLMLDSSRHFQSVDEIKHFIDLMAEYKYNIFHWHLTDDQGWRIEIKSRPKLTEIGAWRVPRQGIWWYRPGPLKNEKPTYGGFYTQEQIKDVVAYAKKRHIQIIPEIDVPGHALAILAAYPELSTTGGPFQVNPGSQFYNRIENTLDPSNPETFKFLDDVFKEVATLFPNPYIHIGGDEATKKFWGQSADVKKYMQEKGIKNTHELQSYFIKRVEKILAKYNKKLIGWDEILEGGLAETATVMSWRGTNGGNKAAQMGRQVIMAANSAYYFDLYQGHATYEPPTYGKLRLKKSYHFDYKLPQGVDQKLLLGLHGCLWTEEVSSQKHAQYMLWPRAFALAEASWTIDRKINWQDFVARTEAHFKRFDARSLNYSRSIYRPLIKLSKKDNRQIIELSTEVDNLTMHYNFEDTYVDHTDPVYTGPLTVPYGATVLKVKTYRNGKPIGHECSIIIKDINKAKKILFPTPVEE